MDQQDLPVFVRWLLLDKQAREPAGKRQTQPLVGFWGSTTIKNARLNDQKERIDVAIEVLTTIGDCSVATAAAEVGALLGIGDAAQVERIRTGYYQRNASPMNERFYRSFLRWRQWVFHASERARCWELRDFEEQFGVRGRDQLEQLINEVRSDPEQAVRQERLEREYGVAPWPYGSPDGGQEAGNDR